MTDHEIVQIAFENLKNNVGIIADWDKLNELDRQISIHVKDQIFNFKIEIRHELRNYQLLQIFDLSEQFHPLMVIANHIFPKIKEVFRQKQIAYLETNGNIYFQQNNTTIWIDTQKPIQLKKGKGNRAFTKTGLKVVFYFLLNENILNQPYREIAKQTNVGLGNINYILSGLKELGFLVQMDKTQYRLINKKELLHKWIAAYGEKLKPTIHEGTYRFLKEAEFINWRWIQLNIGKTWWGGEPAGDLLTGYLRPAELTLYTNETRTELMKNYRLIPDEKGNVMVYKKFWQNEEENDNFVAPLLVYADLINSDDSRCQETGIMVYKKFLQNKF